MRHARLVVSAALLLAGVGVRAQDDRQRFIAAVEHAQSPGHQGPDPFTLRELMDRYHEHGEGWYFSHGGSNWGFRWRAILDRVARAYNWDSLDKPLLR